MNYLLLVGTFLTVILTQAYYYMKFKELEKKVDQLLEEKVDEVLNTLKHEVPMGSTFLRGALEEKLRQKALILVKKMMPDLKGKSINYRLILIPLLIAFGVSLLISTVSSSL